MEPTEAQQENQDESPLAGEKTDKAKAQPAPAPDERGPHDVPDDKVIEETLPRRS